MSHRKSNYDQWLSEVANALAEAERLTGLLASTRPRGDMSLAVVQAEIMGLRREVERLRREREGTRRQDFDPDWLQLSAWSGGTSG